MLGRSSVRRLNISVIVQYELASELKITDPFYRAGHSFTPPWRPQFPDRRHEAHPSLRALNLKFVVSTLKSELSVSFAQSRSNAATLNPLSENALL